ncbi:MAG: hypothetical protein WCA30_07110 [Dermatophilaceae bacterium]
MTETLAGLPVPIVALALWAFALVRGAGYYLLGRLSRGRPDSRLHDWAVRVSKGRLIQAEEYFERVGPKSIILAYPFYGVSAGTQIVAGGLHMPLPTFYLALGVVSLPWASMQAVIGIAAFQAIVAGYTPWVLAGAVALLAGWWLVRRHLRLRAERIG